MKKWLFLIIMVVIGLAVVNAATKEYVHRAPCGLGGHVYNSDGQLAGAQLYTIVVKRTDAPGTAGYHYFGDSEYRIDCTDYLVTGYWHAYAVTREFKNGQWVYRYSTWCPVFYWTPHINCGTHNFYCTEPKPPVDQTME